MNRRIATKKLAAAGAAIAAAAGAGWMVVRAWLPWITRGPDGRWLIGPRSRFPLGSAVLLRRAAAIVVHDADGIHAMSAVCTHEACLVHDLPARHELICPCHGSAFTYRGEVKRGPAQAPLPWLELSADGEDLVLDPSQTVPRT